MKKNNSLGAPSRPDEPAFGYGASGGSPPSRSVKHTPSVPADSAPDEPDVPSLRESMRAALIQSYLWRNCAATRFDEERTLVTRKWRRRK